MVGPSRQRIDQMKTNVGETMKKRVRAGDERSVSPYPPSRTSEPSHETSDTDEPGLRTQRALLNSHKTAIDHLKSVTGKNPIHQT